jgi:peptide/nickel transport system permease protein
MLIRDYLIRRLMVLPILLIGVSIIVFALTRIGGSPIGIYLSHEMTPEEVEQLEDRYGLNDPLPVQYVAWAGGVLRGDLGWSGVAVAPVTTVFPSKLTATMELAIMLLIIFWVYLGWFPVGRSTPDIWASIAHPTGLYTVDSLMAGSWQAFRDAIWHLVLPAITLGLATTAIITRMMRSSLVEELNEDYVDAARAKGLPERLVLKRHARRNALIPTITVIGLSFGFLLQGTVVVEIIYQWPGLGRWLADAVLRGDQATIMAYVLFTSVLFLTVNLAVDIIYAYLDRRVVLGG